MASIKERNGKFCVIYHYIDNEGKRRQRWETYDTKAEAKKRKNEVEYKLHRGTFTVPKCKTLKELLQEYIILYGKEKWALSTYEGNTGQINNYINPMIGDVPLDKVNTRFIESYYQELLKTPAVINPITGKSKNKFVSTGTIQDIHKILHSCFEQAIKWEIMEKNPCDYATVPKHKEQKRGAWSVDHLMKALDDCDSEYLKLALNIAFVTSVRIGELLALTWDCVDISEEAIEEGRSYIYINKELQRVQKDTIKALNGKDIIITFPEKNKLCKTVRVLKTPKTDSSIRKIYIPKSVALMLVEWKKQQDDIKEILREDYNDYNLVMASSYGMPGSESHIRSNLKKLIEKNNLPSVVFHSMRHTSVTYKLKLNGGDIKSVQGDSGHSQSKMVTDVYAHIIDDDRRKNAEIFENAFYNKENLNPQIHETQNSNFMNPPDGIDTELIFKALSNPEMAALLSAFAKKLEKS